MFGVIVVTAKDRRRMCAKGLVNDGLNAMPWNYRLLRIPLDVFGGDDLFRNDDNPAARLPLLFVLPGRSADLAIALTICDLHVNEGDIRG